MRRRIGNQHTRKAQPDARRNWARKPFTPNELAECCKVANAEGKAMPAAGMPECD
jgi:hypothetical protein